MTNGNADPNRMAQLCELADIVFKWGYADPVIFSVKDEALQRGNDSLSPTTDELLFSTISAFRSDGSALFVDWNEGPILAQTCQWAFDQILQKPAPSGARRCESSPFVWDDEDVPEGIEAFAAWLRQSHPHLSMLNLQTGSDFYFAPVCLSATADQAVAQMEVAGLAGSVIEGVEHTGISALSVIAKTAELAVNDHGFTASTERVGRFHKEINAKFSTVIDVVPEWSYDREEYLLYIRMYLAHHQINELGRSLMHDERMVTRFPTIELPKSRPLGAESLSHDTFADWLQGEEQTVTPDDVEAEFIHCLQYGSAKYAPWLLNILLQRKWSKNCDNSYLKRWDKRVNDAKKKGIDSLPTYRRNAATAESVREYLTLHSIPHS